MNSPLEQLRSLGFGGMLGAGLSGLGGLLFFAALKEESPTSIDLSDIMFVGALIGAGLHRVIERYFVWVLGPVGGFIMYYSRIFELMLLRRSGVISEARTREILDELTVRHFFGKEVRREESRLLPPSQSFLVDGANSSANPGPPADR